MADGLHITSLIWYLKAATKNLTKSCLVKNFNGALDSLPASGDVCYLLITFANSLYPDQDRQNLWPNLDQTV